MLAIGCYIAIILVLEESNQMNVLNYLKEIYCDKKSLFIQVSLLSLIGIMTISGCEYLTYILGNLFSAFLGYATGSHYVLSIELFVFLMLLIFFSGYLYNFSNNVFNKDSKLPDLSLAGYQSFVKMLPVFIVWIIYLMISLIILFIGLRAESVLFYTYLSIVICILPFINLIWVLYSKDFVLNRKYFSILFLLKVIDKTFLSMVNLVAQTIIVGILPTLIISGIIKYSNTIKHTSFQLGLRLGGICSSVYVLYILFLVFNLGLVKISENKLKGI